ncbi:MAG: CPBP family intramembrane metalloprotease [Planctomycetaceae bacterium]|nr:CPBP family intramembrane metalloprotease [Planctomycetales bacterium]MCB9873799.1 CPBP family intramembrane metalloprotease [Planctomycetaceae bacterium]MCB9939710.1 CPBP family intramembrane metalloprotease [Planctomycetaceae bacterium]
MTSHIPNDPPPDRDDAISDAYAAYETPQATVFDAAITDEAVAAPQITAAPHPHIGWAILWMFAFWVVQIGVSVAVAMVAMGLAIAQGHNSATQIERAMANASVVMIPIGTLFSVITSVVIAYIFYRRQFGVRLALRGMTRLQCLTSVLAVLPLAVIASEITNCAGEVLPSFNAEVLSQFAASPWPIVFVAACLFPAIGEEIFCRGFLGRGLVANHGVVAGVLLASLLFGVMHIDPVQSVGAFVLGIGLHFVYLTTRSLLAPMLVHMLNNAFAFWLMQNYTWCPLPGLSPLPDDTPVHTPWGVMITAIVACAALLGVLYQTRTRWMLASDHAQDEGDQEWSPGYVTAERPPRDVPCHAANAPMKYWLAAFVLLSYFALLVTLAIESHAVATP